MKRTTVLATLLGLVALLTTSCGTSDSIKSILLTATGASSGGFFNLAGQDGTVQLKVFAIYNSGKQVDVTNASTWNVVSVGVDDSAPPQLLPPYGPDTVPINGTGLMTGIVAICTWTDVIDQTKTPPAPASPPIWQYTGFYQTTATYKGMTSQPVAIGVGVTASNAPTGGCGPS